MKKTRFFHGEYLYYLVFLCVCIGMGSGCGGSKDLFESQTDTELFEQGEQYYQAGDYKNALEYFLYVKEHFVRSPYSGLTRFYAGESYFGMEHYADAAIEYQSFLSFFPNDPHAAAAQYKLGVSYLKQTPGPERDQSMIKKALKELQKVRENYPENTEYVAKAEEQIRKTQNKLAQHEFLVASFYHKVDQYDSSNHRLEYLLQQYPETEYVPEALWLHGRNYLELNQAEAAKTDFLRLVQNYPESSQASEAREKLTQLGVTNLPELVSHPVSLPDPPEKQSPKPQPETPMSNPPDSGQLSIPSVEGTVVLIRGETVFTDLIRADGVQEGMVLRIYRNNLFVGSLRITEIQDGFSIGDVVSLAPGMTILEEDTVCCPQK